MGKPAVSIIIPCYNSEKWIVDSLQSIYNQTYKNFEVIVIDDGSEDNTNKIVQEFDSSIIYKYQKNKGPAAARNLGVKIAKGDYIAFLDSDDLWEKNKLEKQLSYLNKNKEVDLILTNVTVVNENGSFLFHHDNNVPSDKEELIRAFFLGKIVMNTPTIFMKKEVFNEVGGFIESLPLREDHFFLMVVSKRYKVGHIKDYLVKRRIRESSISHDINPNEVLELNRPFIKISLENFPFLKKYENQVLSNLNISIGKRFWKLGDFNNSRTYFKKSIMYQFDNYKSYLYFVLVTLRLEYKNVNIVINKIKRTKNESFNNK